LKPVDIGMKVKFEVKVKIKMAEPVT